MVYIREGLYVQIVRFTAKSGDAHKLAEAVQGHLSEWISKCSGFVSANLHVSEDGTHMINYAQWRNKESFEEFLQNEHQDSLKKSIQACKPEKMESDSFELVAQQSIEDQFWSKPRF